MSYLQLRDITKSFDKVEVVKHLSLDIEKGELMSFLGPSGCGKTTTLNMIAGFLDVDGGSILVDGVPVHHLPPYKRNLGMVFQNYALFPHMTVFENVAFGLKLRKVPRPEIETRVKAVLEMSRLEKLKGRYPKELSGGQQQRVAISRALAIQPTVLLLDEPLSNLDAKLRREMREEIIEIRKRVGITTIFVTHDQEEALAISDRIAVMNGGKIEQVDKPQSIYDHPQTPFVASFIGEVNRLPGTVVDVVGNKCTVEVFSSRFMVEKPLPSEKQVFLYVRPEKLAISKVKPEKLPAIVGRVDKRIFLGAKTRFLLKVLDYTLVAEMPHINIDDSSPQENEETFIYWQEEDVLMAGNEV